METFNTRIPRELAVQYGEQAVQIMRQGVYRAPSGRNVTIADLVEHSTQGTISYPQKYPCPMHTLEIIKPRSRLPTRPPLLLCSAYTNQDTTLSHSISPLPPIPVAVFSPGLLRRRSISPDLPASTRVLSRIPCMPFIAHATIHSTLIM